MNAFIRDGAPRRRKRRAEKKVDRCHAKKKRRTDDGRRHSSSTGRGENSEVIVSIPVRHMNSSVVCERRHRDSPDVDCRHDDAATSSRQDDAATSAATAADDDDSDDVVLVEPTWPTIDLTVADDENGACGGHDVAGESPAEQNPVELTECEDDSSYPADFIPAIQKFLDAYPRNSHDVAHKRLLPQDISAIPDLRRYLDSNSSGFTDFEKIDDLYVNNKFKNFLKSFDENKKTQYLIKMLKQCYKVSEGSLNKSMQMMQQIETKAYPLVVNEESIISSSKDGKKSPTKEEILNSRIRKQYLVLFGEEHLESDYKTLSRFPIVDFSHESNIIDVDSIYVESEILEDKNMVDLDEPDDIYSSTKNSFGLTIRPKVTDGRTVVAHRTKCDNPSTKSYFRNQSSTNTSTKSSQFKEANTKEKQENHKSDVIVTDDRSVVIHSITSDNTSIQSSSHFRNHSSVNMYTKLNQLEEANTTEKQEKHKSDVKVTDISVVTQTITSDNTFIQPNSHCKNQSITSTFSKSSHFKRVVSSKVEQEKNKSDSEVNNDCAVVTHSITSDNASTQSNSHFRNQSSTSNMSEKSSQLIGVNAKEKQEKHKSDIKVTDDHSVVIHSITSDNTSIQSSSHFRNNSSVNMYTKLNQLEEVNTKEKQEKHKSDVKVTDISVVTQTITSDNTFIQPNSHCKNQSITSTFSKSSHFKGVVSSKAEQEKNKSDSEVTDVCSVVTHSIPSDNVSIQSNSHLRNQSSTSNMSEKSSQLIGVNAKEKQEKHKSGTKVIDDRLVVTHSTTNNNISMQSNSHFRNESSTIMSSKIRHIVDVNVNKVLEENISDPDIINFIIDNNVEIVNTSESEKLKFDKLIKRIQSKICKVVKPNDDIYKSNIIKELASYFSITNFLYDFDFSLKTIESKLFGELLVKFFEKFNDTERNMAYLSGCLICIFHGISTKSYAPSEIKQHLILFLDFIKKFAKYCDNTFWRNWFLSKMFLDWCFVLNSIFHKNSSVISLKDESIWTNAKLYLKKIKRHKYVFKNCYTKERKLSGGIFELTNSDDLLEINNDSSENISETATNLSSDETIAGTPTPTPTPVPEHPKIAVCSEFSLSNSFKNDFCCVRVNDQKSKESEPVVNDLNIAQNDTLNISSNPKEAEYLSEVQKDPPVNLNDKNQPTIIINGIDGNVKKNGTKRKNNPINSIKSKKLPSQHAYYTVGNNPQKFSIACSSLPNCEQTQKSCPMGISQPSNNSNTQPASTKSIRLPNETIIQPSNVITGVLCAEKTLLTNAMNTQIPGVTYPQLPSTKSPPPYEMRIQSSNPTNIQSSCPMDTPQTTNYINIQPSYSINTPQTSNSLNIQPSYFMNTSQTSNAMNIQPSYSMNTHQTSNVMNIQPSYSTNTMNVQPSCPVNIPQPSKRKKKRNVKNMQQPNVKNTQSVNNLNTQPSNTTKPQNPVGMSTQFTDMNFLNSAVLSNSLNPYSRGALHAYTMNSQHMTSTNTQPSSALNPKNSNIINAQYSTMRNSSTASTVNTQASSTLSSQNSNSMNHEYSAMTNPPTMNTVNTKPSSAFNSQNCNAMNSQYSAVVGSIDTNIVNDQLVCALKSVGSNSLNAQYAAVINSKQRNVVNTRPQYLNATTPQNSTQLNAQHLVTSNSRLSNEITSQSNQSVTNVQQHLISTNGPNINTYQQYNVYNNVNYTNMNYNANHNVIPGQPNTYTSANYDSTSLSHQLCCNSTASCYSCPSQYPAQLDYTQPPSNISQPSVAMSSSLNGITLDQNYGNPQHSNHYDPSRTSVIHHPVRTTGTTDFWSSDYNSQVSPDLPNSLSPNMPNQFNKCMASDCTDISKFTCDRCCHARYCSYKCQGNDWHYHKNECRKQ